MTAAELQRAIDDCYANLGGVVSLRGTVEASDPINLYSCVTLKGEQPHRDILNSKAKVSIIITNAPGNASGPEKVTVQGIGIRNQVGGGVALSEYVRTKTSSHDLIFNDLEIDTAGPGIDIEHTSPDPVSYRPALRRVRIVSGATAAKINGRSVIVDDGCSFNTRRGSGNSGLILKGEGVLRSSQIHDDWGKGAYALFASGIWNIESAWIESVSGVKLDAARVTTGNTETWFAQPKQPIILANGSVLSVSGLVGWTDNNGMKTVTADKCYLCDKSSRVMQGNAAIVGKVN